MSQLRVSAKTGETTMDGLTVISTNCEGCCGGSACAFHVEAWRKASRSQGDRDHAGECGTRCVWGDKRCPVVRQGKVDP